MITKLLFCLLFVGITSAKDRQLAGFGSGIQDIYRHARLAADAGDEEINLLELGVEDMDNLRAPDFLDLTRQCHYDMAQIFKWLNDTNDGSLLRQWRDYHGRRTPAIRDGSFRWTGVFDSCVDRFILPARYPGDDDTGGQFCWGMSKIGIRVGFCFPKSCSEEELLQFIPIVLSEATDATIVEQRLFASVECVVQYPPLTDLAIAGICVFSFIGFVVVAGTTYDVLLRMNWVRKIGAKDDSQGDYKIITLNGSQGTIPKKQTVEDSKAHSALLSFSFYTNTAKIWNVRGDDVPGAISCVHGLRVLSLIWVITGHVFSQALPYQDNILTASAEAFSDFHLMWILEAEYAVDTFFFLSGLLTMYLGMKQVRRFKVSQERKGAATKDRIIGWLKFWATYYFHRYWRLTPLMGGLILFAVSLYHFTFPYKSPFFYEYWYGCDSEWWKNLLYIQNLVKPPAGVQLCQGHTWYLANDMQFYWFSPVVLLSALMSPWLGGAVIFMGVLEAMLSSGITNNFEHNYINEFEESEPDRFFIYYIAPWTRCGVYFVGMGAGYIILEGKRKLHWWQVTLGWTCSTVLCLALTYGMYPILADYYRASQFVSDFFWACNRVTWGFCMAWITIACHWGYGGAVNHFLSHPAWRPLSRLNYAAYLFHMFCLFYMYHTQMTLSHFFKTTTMYQSITCVILTYAAAHVASCTMEAPLIGLEKLFLPRH